MLRSNQIGTQSFRYWFLTKKIQTFSLKLKTFHIENDLLERQNDRCRKKHWRCGKTQWQLAKTATNNFNVWLMNQDTLLLFLFCFFCFYILWVICGHHLICACRRCDKLKFWLSVWFMWLLKYKGINYFAYRPMNLNVED